MCRQPAEVIVGADDDPILSDGCLPNLLISVAVQPFVADSMRVVSRLTHRVYQFSWQVLIELEAHQAAGVSTFGISSAAPSAANAIAALM